MRASTLSIPRSFLPRSLDARLVARLCLFFGSSFWFPATLAADPGPTDYRIAPRDLIKFEVFEEPDTVIVQRVSASGELPLPMIGIVNVAGLTLREAEVKLRTMYVDGGFFVNPQVILVLEQYDERSVSVLGQVNNPEQIRFPLEAETMSIVHAITLAGGLSRLARADAVQVTRAGTDNVEEHFIINLEDFLVRGRNKTPDSSIFQLRPGDVVFVPERNF